MNLNEIVKYALERSFELGEPKEKVISNIEKYIARGHITSEEIQPLVDKMYPPVLDEEGNEIEKGYILNIPDPNMTLEERVTQLELLRLQDEGVI